MLRHRSLEPFSRDHNQGLNLARALMLGRPSAIRDAQKAWDAELKDHFNEEERCLLPLCSQASGARLLAEHKELADRILLLPHEPEVLGRLLESHIRWEERELFPEIEQNATPEQFEQLAALTTEVEKRRWPTDPKREELVRRRWEKQG